MRPYLESRGVRILTKHRVEKVLKRSSKGVTLRILGPSWIAFCMLKGT